MSHGIDIEYELMEYDRRRTGVISPLSLHRCLSSLGITVLTEQVQDLASVYQVPGGLDVRRIIKDIEDAPRPEDVAFSSLPLCMDELKVLAQALSARQVTLRDALRHFDTLNTGRVPSDAFFRVFGLSRPMRVIVRDFGNQVTGELDYFRVQAALRHAGLMNDVRASEFARPELPRSFASLVRAVRAHGIDVKAMFSQSDRLVAGKMAPRQFAAVLSSINHNLTALEVEKITRCFIDDDNLCSYGDLCRAIDEYKLPPIPVSAAVVQGEQELERPVSAEDILQKVIMVIAERRMNPREYFNAQMCDGAKELITKARFQRILNAMRLDLTTDEVDKLASLFEGPANTVCYPKFLEAVVKNEQGHVETVDEVLDRMREFLLKTKQVLAGRMQRYDREGSGEISFVQLASAIRASGFVVTPHELVEIRDMFAGTQYDGVKWHALCARVDPTPHELGPTLSDLRRAALREQESVPSYSAPPEPVAGIVLRIAQACEEHGIIIQDEFLAQDRSNSGHLAQEKFIAVLKTLPLILHPSDLRTIVHYYREMGAYTINYVLLCRDSVELLKLATEEEARPKPPPPPPPTPTIPPLPLHVHAFLQKYKQFAELKGIPPFIPFELHDKNMTGYVHVSKISECFHKAGFAPTRDEVVSIIRCFCDSRRTEWFNYKLFSYAVDCEDITEKSARELLATVTLPVNFAAEAATTVGTIREKLLARNRHIQLAFAGVRGDTVAIDDFTRRLESLDVVLNPEQTQALIKKYRMNTSDRVNWTAFCRDVENSRTIGF